MQEWCNPNFTPPQGEAPRRAAAPSSSGGASRWGDENEAKIDPATALPSRLFVARNWLPLPRGEGWGEGHEGRQSGALRVVCSAIRSSLFRLAARETDPLTPALSPRERVLVFAGALLDGRGRQERGVGSARNRSSGKDAAHSLDIFITPASPSREPRKAIPWPRSSGRVQRRGQPGAGVGPLAERRGAGDAQRLGGLVDRQPGEEAMAGDLGRGRVLRASRSSAASTSSTRSGSAPSAGASPSRAIVRAPPPRRAALRRRAWSTRIRCMATAAARKKPLRSANDASPSRRYASWTSAVASSECPARSPASRAAASRFSSS